MRLCKSFVERRYSLLPATVITPCKAPLSTFTDPFTGSKVGLSYIESQGLWSPRNVLSSLMQYLSKRTSPVASLTPSAYNPVRLNAIWYWEISWRVLGAFAFMLAIAMRWSFTSSEVVGLKVLRALWKATMLLILKKMKFSALCYNQHIIKLT